MSKLVCAREIHSILLSFHKNRDDAGIILSSLLLSELNFRSDRSYNILSVRDMKQAASLLGVCQGKISKSTQSNYRI